MTKSCAAPGPQPMRQNALTERAASADLDAADVGRVARTEQSAAQAAERAAPSAEAPTSRAVAEAAVVVGRSPTCPPQTTLPNGSPAGCRTSGSAT